MQPSNWSTAYNHCAVLGKALLAIETEEENNAVVYYLQQIEGKVTRIDILCDLLSGAS